MSDWVPASRRTRRYILLVSTLWLGGVVTGMLSASTNDPLDVVCDVFLFTMLAICVAVIGWSAMQCGPRSRLRWGWMIGAIALGVGFVASAAMVAAAWASPGARFSGQSLGMTLGFLVGGVGLAIAASDVGLPGERLEPFLQALGLSAVVLAVMLAALLAPGPLMPFAVGARDVVAVWRLVIDCGVLFLACVYATLAQLRMPQGQRARAWMWASAGALVLAMGDVGAPLVDLGHGQIYPTMLWGLGVILFGVAASMFADFEIAERAEPAAETLAQP